MQEFNLGSALMHFRTVQSKGTFLWKFMLVYVIATVIVTVLAATGLSMLFPSGVDGVAGSEQTVSLSWFFAIAYILWVVASLVLGAVFEASILRRYVRDAEFSIGFGADELRILCVYFLWLLTIIALYVFSIIVILLINSIFALVSEALIFLSAAIGVLMVVCGIVFVIVRLAPAAAITTRDRSISFYKVRKVTKGHFWSLFGAYLLTTLALTLGMVAVMGAYAAFTGDAVSLSIGTDVMNPFEIYQGVLGGAFFIVMTMMQGFYWYVLAGIPAKLALADPNWSGAYKSADTFD